MTQFGLLGVRDLTTGDEVLTLAGYERYELAHALLHALLGLFGDLGVVRESIFHDPGHWRKVPYVSIELVVLLGLARTVSRRLRRHGGRRIVRHSQ